MGEVAKPVPKTLKGLRLALFDEINGIRSNKTTLGRAATVHKLATQIIELTKLEVHYGQTVVTMAKQVSAKLV